MPGNSDLSLKFAWSKETIMTAQTHSLWKFVCACMCLLLAAACSAPGQAPTVAVSTQEVSTEPSSTEPAVEPTQAQATQAPSGEGDTITVGVKPEVVNVDATKAGHSTLDGILQHIVEPLIYKDANGQFQPRLATEWSSSEDGTVWTFTLREGVTFHDGEPFNAEAVRLTFQRMQNPDFALARGSFYAPIIEVSVVDDYTVSFRTEQPWGPILSYLSYVAAGITSPSLADQKDITHLVGTGPFQLESWQPGDETVLVRNDNYWGETARVARLVYREIPDDEARIAALETGEIDVALAAPPQLTPSFEDNPDYVVISMPSEETLSIDLIVTRPPFDDPAVRKAFLRAIDMDAIVSGVMFGSAVPQNAFPSCAPGVTGCIEVADYHRYDPDEARQLLADAGYGDGVTVELLYPAPRYNRHVEILTALQAQVKEVGFDLQLTPMEFAAFSAEYRKPLEETDFNMVSWGWVSYIGDIAYNVNSRLPSANISPACCNLMGYASDEADALIEAANAETDPAQRDAILKELQELVYEDLPIISLLRYNIVALQSARVEGVEYVPGNNHWFVAATKAP